MEKKYLFNFLIYSLFVIISADSQNNGNNISEFENPTNCGNQASNWKPCIRRQFADKVFTACCQKNLPKNCHDACVYETFSHDAQLNLINLILPNQCPLFKYLSSIVNCAAQTHNNAECCRDKGIHEINEKCLNLCRPQPDKPALWGSDFLEKEYVQCLSKWDEILYCHQSGLRARKIYN